MAEDVHSPISSSNTVQKDENRQETNTGLAHFLREFEHTADRLVTLNNDIERLDEARRASYVDLTTISAKDVPLRPPPLVVPDSASVRINAADTAHRITAMPFPELPTPPDILQSASSTVASQLAAPLPADALRATYRWSVREIEQMYQHHRKLLFRWQRFITGQRAHETAAPAFALRLAEIEARVRDARDRAERLAALAHHTGIDIYDAADSSVDTPGTPFVADAPTALTPAAPAAPVGLRAPSDLLPALPPAPAAAATAAGRRDARAQRQGVVSGGCLTAADLRGLLRHTVADTRARHSTRAVATAVQQLPLTQRFATLRRAVKCLESLPADLLPTIPANNHELSETLQTLGQQFDVAINDTDDHLAGIVRSTMVVNQRLDTISPIAPPGAGSTGGGIEMFCEASFPLGDRFGVVDLPPASVVIEMPAADVPAHVTPNHDTVLAPAATASPEYRYTSSGSSLVLSRPAVPEAVSALGPETALLELMPTPERAAFLERLDRTPLRVVVNLADAGRVLNEQAARRGLGLPAVVADSPVADAAAAVTGTDTMLRSVIEFMREIFLQLDIGTAAERVAAAADDAGMKDSAAREGAGATRTLPQPSMQRIQQFAKSIARANSQHVSHGLSAATLDRLVEQTESGDSLSDQETSEPTRAATHLVSLQLTRIRQLRAVLRQIINFDNMVRRNLQVVLFAAPGAPSGRAPASPEHCDGMSGRPLESAVPTNETERDAVLTERIGVFITGATPGSRLGRVAEGLAAVDPVLFSECTPNTRVSEAVRGCRDPVHAYSEVLREAGTTDRSESASYPWAMHTAVEDAERTVRVHDAAGRPILYAETAVRLAQLERELLMVATHFVQAAELRSSCHEGATASDGAPLGTTVDRVAVLLDLYEQEYWFALAKRRVVCALWEIFEHAVDPSSILQLARRILTVLDHRPNITLPSVAVSGGRISVGGPKSFKTTYALEIVQLELTADLITNSIAVAVAEHRAITASTASQLAAQLAAIGAVPDTGPAAFSAVGRLPGAPLPPPSTPMPNIKFAPDATPVGILDVHGVVDDVTNIIDALDSAVAELTALHLPAAGSALLADILANTGASRAEAAAALRMAVVDLAVTAQRRVLQREAQNDPASPLGQLFRMKGIVSVDDSDAALGRRVRMQGLLAPDALRDAAAVDAAARSAAINALGRGRGVAGKPVNDLDTVGALASEFRRALLRERGREEGGAAAEQAHLATCRRLLARGADHEDRDRVAREAATLDQSTQSGVTAQAIADLGSSTDLEWAGSPLTGLPRALGCVLAAYNLVLLHENFLRAYNDTWTLEQAYVGQSRGLGAAVPRVRLPDIAWLDNAVEVLSEDAVQDRDGGAAAIGAIQGVRASIEAIASAVARGACGGQATMPRLAIEAFGGGTVLQGDIHTTAGLANFLERESDLQHNASHIGDTTDGRTLDSHAVKAGADIMHGLLGAFQWMTAVQETHHGLLLSLLRGNSPLSDAVASAELLWERRARRQLTPQQRQRVLQYAGSSLGSTGPDPTFLTRMFSEENEIVEALSVGGGARTADVNTGGGLLAAASSSHRSSVHQLLSSARQPSLLGPGASVHALAAQHVDAGGMDDSAVVDPLALALRVLPEFTTFRGMLLQRLQPLHVGMASVLGEVRADTARAFRDAARPLLRAFTSGDQTAAQQLDQTKYCFVVRYCTQVADESSALITRWSAAQSAAAVHNMLAGLVGPTSRYMQTPLTAALRIGGSGDPGSGLVDSHHPHQLPASPGTNAAYTTMIGAAVSGHGPLQRLQRQRAEMGVPELMAPAPFALAESWALVNGAALPVPVLYSLERVVPGFRAVSAAASLTQTAADVTVHKSDSDSDSDSELEPDVVEPLSAGSSGPATAIMPTLVYGLPWSELALGQPVGVRETTTELVSAYNPTATTNELATALAAVGADVPVTSTGSVHPFVVPSPLDLVAITRAGESASMGAVLRAYGMTLSCLAENLHMLREEAFASHRSEYAMIDGDLLPSPLISHAAAAYLREIHVISWDMASVVTTTSPSVAGADITQLPRLLRLLISSRDAIGARVRLATSRLTTATMMDPQIMCPSPKIDAVISARGVDMLNRHTSAMCPCLLPTGPNPTTAAAAAFRGVTSVEKTWAVLPVGIRGELLSVPGRMCNEVVVSAIHGYSMHDSTRRSAKDASTAADAAATRAGYLHASSYRETDRRPEGLRAAEAEAAAADDAVDAVLVDLWQTPGYEFNVTNLPVRSPALFCGRRAVEVSAELRSEPVPAIILTSGLELIHGQLRHAVSTTPSSLLTNRRLLAPFAVTTVGEHPAHMLQPWLGRRIAVYLPSRLGPSFAAHHAEACRAAETETSTLVCGNVGVGDSTRACARACTTATYYNNILRSDRIRALTGTLATNVEPTLPMTAINSLGRIVPSRQRLPAGSVLRVLADYAAVVAEQGMQTGPQEHAPLAALRHRAVDEIAANIVYTQTVLQPLCKFIAVERAAAAAAARAAATRAAAAHRPGDISESSERFATIANALSVSFANCEPTHEMLVDAFTSHDAQTRRFTTYLTKTAISSTDKCLTTTTTTTTTDGGATRPPEGAVLTWLGPLFPVITSGRAAMEVKCGIMVVARLLTETDCARLEITKHSIAAAAAENRLARALRAGGLAQLAGPGVPAPLAGFGVTREQTVERAVREGIVSEFVSDLLGRSVRSVLTRGFQVSSNDIHTTALDSVFADMAGAHDIAGGNNDTGIETQSGHKVVVTLTEQHLAGCIDRLAARLSRWQEGAIAMRCDAYHALASSLARSLTTANDRASALSHQLSLERDAVGAHMEATVAERHHDLIFAVDALRAANSTDGVRAAAAAAAARKATRAEYDETVSVLSHKLANAKAEFEQFQDRVRATLTADLASIKSHALADIAESERAPDDLRKVLTQVVEAEKKAQTLLTENSMLQEQLQRLQGSQREAQITVEAEASRAVGAARDEATMLKGELAAAQEVAGSHDRILRRRLLAAETALARALAEGASLRRELDVLDLDRAALVRWKLATQRQLNELSAQLRRLQRFSRVDVDALQRNLSEREEDLRTAARENASIHNQLDACKAASEKRLQELQAKVSEERAARDVAVQAAAALEERVAALETRLAESRTDLPSTLTARRSVLGGLAARPSSAETDAATWKQRYTELAATHRATLLGMSRPASPPRPSSTLAATSSTLAATRRSTMVFERVAPPPASRPPGFVSGSSVIPARTCPSSFH